MPFTITINHVISLSPAMEAIVMAKIDEMQAKLDTIQAALDAEKAEGDAMSAEIASLKAQLAGGLSADEAAAIEARLDELTAKIPTIVTPDAPAPEPQPEPAPENA